MLKKVKDVASFELNISNRGHILSDYEILFIEASTDDLVKTTIC